MFYPLLCLVALIPLTARAEPHLMLDRLSGQIELRDGKPPLTELTLTLSNSGDTPISTDIGFKGSESALLTLEAGEVASITPVPAITFEGSAGQLQTVVIDLSLTVPNDTSASISETDIEFLLPEPAYPVVMSEPRLLDNTAELTGLHYEYYKENRENGLMTIVYNPGPVNLSIRKTLYPIPVVTGPVTVTIDVTNFGAEDAKSLTLTDHLKGEEFSGEGEEFSHLTVDGKDDLQWVKKIESLPSGTSARFTYEVNALADIGDTELPVTEAFIDGELIGYSNKVWLPKWH